MVKLSRLERSEPYIWSFLAKVQNADTKVHLQDAIKSLNELQRVTADVTVSIHLLRQSFAWSFASLLTVLDVEPGAQVCYKQLLDKVCLRVQDNSLATVQQHAERGTP